MEDFICKNCKHYFSFKVIKGVVSYPQEQYLVDYVISSLDKDKCLLSNYTIPTKLIAKATCNRYEKMKK